MVNRVSSYFPKNGHSAIKTELKKRPDGKKVGGGDGGFKDLKMKLSFFCEVLTLN